MEPILITALAVVAITLVVLLLAEKKKSKVAANQKAASEAANETRFVELNKAISSLEAQKSRLAKYSVIIDAEQEAKRIVTEAQAALEAANANAERIKALALAEANTLRDKARNRLDRATAGADGIIAEAKEKADQIAGEARQIVAHATEAEATVVAMRNIIKGYGDDYIVPAFELLDQLADDYSHTIAGEELKAVRSRIRLLIKEGRAAQCDYSEPVRKQTAINFVLDAFNGKTDSIISNLKRDNYGTLSQKIKDAFAIVNNNGAAFRNARITNQYLMMRLEELKWAATIQELKLKEREEQRLIKEQIREEEKARRDFEKAQQEARKEEDLLKKAMDKARRELGGATEAQRAKYELQLQELSQRLTAAEEKNKRALSMAQQTKTGHVYVISNVGSFGENVYKIGMTRRLEPLDRVKELGDASVPFEFDVHAMLLSNDAPHLERELHKRFVRAQVNKVNARKEFFKTSLADIKQVVEEMGIHAKWTQISEAREYRESLAVLEGLENHTIDEKEWMRRTIEHIPADLQEEEEEGHLN